MNIKKLFSILLINKITSKIVTDPCLCFTDNMCYESFGEFNNGCYHYNDISYCYVVGYEKCEYAKKSKNCLDNNGENLYYLVWDSDICPKFDFIEDGDIYINDLDMIDNDINYEEIEIMME